MKSLSVLPLGLSRLLLFVPWYTDISICGIGNEFDRRLACSNGTDTSSLIFRSLFNVQPKTKMVNTLG